VTDSDSPPSGAPVTGLSHVQLLVSDVRASAEWYRVALGLESYVEDFDIGYVALRHRDAKFVVVLTAPDAEESPGNELAHQRRALASERLDHLAFAVPDEPSLRAWAEYLARLGVAHAGIVLEKGNPSLQLRDPDGIAIELVAPGRRA
jgi:glyoxylase I family protein